MDAAAALALPPPPESDAAVAELEQLLPLRADGDGAVGQRAFSLAPEHAKMWFPRNAAALSQEHMRVLIQQAELAAWGRHAVLSAAAAQGAAKRHLLESAGLDLHRTTMLRALMHAAVAGAPRAMSRVRALHLAASARGVALLEARGIADHTASDRSRIAAAAVGAVMGVSAEEALAVEAPPRASAWAALSRARAPRLRDPMRLLDEEQV